MCLVCGGARAHLSTRGSRRRSSAASRTAGPLPIHTWVSVPIITLRNQRRTDSPRPKAPNDCGDVVRPPATLDERLTAEERQRLVRSDALLGFRAAFDPSPSRARRRCPAPTRLAALALEPSGILVRLLAEDPHAGLLAVVDPAVRLEVRDHALRPAVSPRRARSRAPSNAPGPPAPRPPAHPRALVE